MKVFGLTGGIASGKSTVAAMFADLGVPIVDADTLARHVVRAGSPGFAQVVDHFGARFVAADGELDRPALGDEIFGDANARAQLNAIVHPLVSAESQARLDALASQGHLFAIYSVPLLYETGLYRKMGASVLVSVPEEIQLARLTTRDGLEEGRARSRLAAQMPLAHKLALADYIIDNRGSLATTRAQVEALHPRLARQASD